jgi:PKD repeat protein
VGTSTLSSTFTPTDSSNYNTVTKNVTITVVNQVPVSDFTQNSTGGGVGTTIQFNDSSSNFPTSWLWNFGDGSTSSSQNPTHQYTTCGTFTVTLRATNSAGSNTATKTGLITINPIANFTGTPTTGPYPLSVTFTSNSLGNSLSYAWFFSDGTTSTSQNPVHVFQTAGTYNVALSVLSGGVTDTMTKNGYITVGTSTPVAAFSGTPTSGSSPLSVQFTDQSTGYPTSWAWTFGDGATSTSQNPSHTYSSAGTYTVTLTATNSAGSDTETKTNYITVTPGIVTPVAAFSANPTAGLPPMSVKFTDTSTNSPTSWLWTFGDGQTSTQQSPVHRYSSTGLYTVSLRATNSAGSNTTTKTGYINVTNSLTPPITKFTETDLFSEYPKTVQFNDTSTGTPTAWNWSFGDGTYSTQQNPVHTYSNAGSYDISLNASNAAGYKVNTKIGYVDIYDTSKYDIWYWQLLKSIKYFRGA